MSGPFKLYVGTKLVRAFPESKGPLPGGEEGYAVIYPDGYRSWSPKATFEQAYREVTDAEKELACVWEARGSGVNTAAWEASAKEMSKP